MYFQILEPYDLDTAAGRSIGTPDFKNMFARFYPINTLSGYANDPTVTQSGKYEIIVENDSSISSGVTLGSNATFTMNTKESVHGLKIKAKRYLGSGSTPLDAQFDIFVFQDGIDSGYLRVP